MDDCESYQHRREPVEAVKRTDSDTESSNKSVARAAGQAGNERSGNRALDVTATEDLLELGLRLDLFLLESRDNEGELGTDESFTSAGSDTSKLGSSLLHFALLNEPGRRLDREQHEKREHSREGDLDCHRKG